MRYHFVPLISSQGNQRDRLKWEVNRARGLQLTFGNSSVSGCSGHVGQVPADKSLTSSRTHHREAAERAGWSNTSRCSINNLRSSVDNRKSGIRSINNAIFTFRGPWALSLLSFVVQDDTVDTVVIPVGKCGWKYPRVTDDKAFLRSVRGDPHFGLCLCL